MQCCSEGTELSLEVQQMFCALAHSPYLAFVVTA